MHNKAGEWNEAMRPLNYQVMFDVEDYHWWFVGRRAIVFSTIKDALSRSVDTIKIPPVQILDIGCGTGATMDHLKEYGQVHGIDLSEMPLGFTQRRGHNRILCASAEELPFESNSFSFITALDVIEHLDDDVKGLREIFRVLKPGAFVVVFVPAFQALWGPNDDQSGHKRRYRTVQLSNAIEAAGLKTEMISYANFAMFLPIWAGRKLLKLAGLDETPENRLNHPWLNGLLSRIFVGESVWLKRHRLPFGVSLVCLARKPI